MQGLTARGGNRKRGQPRIASTGVGLDSSQLRGAGSATKGAALEDWETAWLVLNRHSFLSFPICKIAMLSGTRCCKLVLRPGLLAHLSGQCGQGPSDAWGRKEALSP